MDNIQNSVKVGGHITLIFTIQSLSENLDEQGSRGAGICIEKGVEVITNAKKGQGNIKVTSNEKNLSIKLYELIVKEIAKKYQKVSEFDWNFVIQSDLPFGQGFGCSASGALAAVISVLEIINETEDVFQNAISIAHRVERLLSSGLGDVTAIGAGGIELRVEPGLPFPPNKGLILSWSENIPILLCWVNNEEKHTAEYINNKRWIEKINFAGNECLSKLNNLKWEKGIWTELLKQSKRFDEKSGMLKDLNRKNIINTIENLLVKNKINSFWEVRLCMLGTSAIILPTDLENYNIHDLEVIMKELNNLNLNSCITKINANPLHL
ncbi:MAG: hypothetical protein CMB64_03035 [Euryarchaeota archaeon]|nr:hypothetical protein [Euryarchaeota archaeon]|tara:strand:+ start:1543 stop:2514 length:972 start_codon:yes stop_codon:yes gene_type:complete